MGNYVENKDEFNATPNNIVEGETTLVTGYNGIFQKFLNSINFLKDKKLDKGAVSVDYDTAEKIEDKIKGLTPSDIGAYAKSEWITSKATNGYQKLPSGVIIQWGFKNLPMSSTNTQCIFPIAFPNMCFSVVVGEELNASPSGDRAEYANVNSVSVSGCYFRTGYDYDVDAYWVAIGY